MSTKSRRLVVSGIQVEVVRKGIKNLHLGVYPPHGRVRVAAPLVVSDEAVRLAVIGKLGWIRRQQARFAAQPRQSSREMVSGESHYFLGERYRLDLVEREGAAGIEIPNKRRLRLYAPSGATRERKERVLLNWYRRELRQRASALIPDWQKRIGVEVAYWGIKQMKTKWGSCNVDARRIWLNLELAKKPAQCLEYIVVHELVHLVERTHGDAFKTLMDRYLPHWRVNRDELNRSPLAHEEWDY